MTGPAAEGLEMILLGFTILCDLLLLLLLLLLLQLMLLLLRLSAAAGRRYVRGDLHAQVQAACVRRSCNRP
jgi:hypothetical protein